MQSLTRSCIKRSTRFAMAAWSSCVGESPMGQTVRHFPQRKQGSWLAFSAKASENARMPDVPFVTGISRLPVAKPVIGPPKTSLESFSGISPACSNTKPILVPICTR